MAQTLLPYLLEGNLDSPNLLIFLHGYPDTLQLWDPLLPSLKQDYACLRISYPNFDPKHQLKWGLSFEKIVENVKEIADFTDKKLKRKKTLVMHDFGSFIGFLFDEKFPGYLSDIISLDIGLGKDNKSMKKTIFSFVLTFCYQVFLSLSFLVGGFVGNSMTKAFIFLVKKGGYVPKNEKNINCSMNYMYFYLWRMILIGIFKKNKRILNNYVPSCPMAFIYGKDKPFMFHGERFVKRLMEDEKCEVHMVKGGHWVMIAHKDLIIDVIKRRTK